MKTLLFPILATLLTSSFAFGGTIKVLDAITYAPPEPQLTGPAIEKVLRADTRTHNFLISADTYHGLVVLHGSVHAGWQRDEVVRLVRNLPEVVQVFSYIQIKRNTDDLVRDIYEGERYQVTLGNMNERSFVEFPAVGLLSGPTDLARAVKVNLDADVVTGEFEIMVDTFEGLAILHGSVPDDSAKASAQAVAARTPGVDMVYSYITVDDIYERDTMCAPGTVTIRKPLDTSASFAVTLTRPELDYRERQLRLRYAKYESQTPQKK